MFTIIRDEDLRGGVFAGIYMLRENDDVYIGHADVEHGVKKRISCHKSNIKAGRHKYFSKDADVKFEILEICRDDITQDELCELEEDYWRWAKMVGFNLLNKNQRKATTHKVKDTTNMKKAQANGNNPRARRVECEGIIFDCIKECATHYEVNRGTMTKWINDKSKMPQKYIDMGLKEVK